MVLSGARPKGVRQATGRGPGSADANPHDRLFAMSANIWNMKPSEDLG
jgi:hypothetical protein